MSVSHPTPPFEPFESFGFSIGGVLKFSKSQNWIADMDLWS